MLNDWQWGQQVNLSNLIGFINGSFLEGESCALDTLSTLVFLDLLVFAVLSVMTEQIILRSCQMSCLFFKLLELAWVSLFSDWNQ
jgi:hypothetical protein